MKSSKEDVCNALDGIASVLEKVEVKGLSNYKLLTFAIESLHLLKEDVAEEEKPDDSKNQ